MPASPSSVLTLGLGAWGTPSLLITLGYGAGIATTVAPARRFQYKPLRAEDETDIELIAALTTGAEFDPQYLYARDVSAAQLTASVDAVSAFLRQFAFKSNASISGFESSITRFRPILSVETLQAQINDLLAQQRTARFIDRTSIEALIKADSKESFDGWIRQEFTADEIAQMAFVLPKLH